MQIFKNYEETKAVQKEYIKLLYFTVVVWL